MTKENGIEKEIKKIDVLSADLDRMLTDNNPNTKIVVYKDQYGVVHAFEENR